MVSYLKTLIDRRFSMSLLRRIQPWHITHVVVVAFILFLVFIGYQHHKQEEAHKAYCPRPSILAYNGSRIVISPEVDPSTDLTHTNTLSIRDEKSNIITSLRVGGMRFSSPSWSPTGDYVVFVATPTGEQTNSEIWQLIIEPAELRVLASFEDWFQHPNHPQVSPEGNYVIFDAYSGIREINVTTLEGEWVRYAGTEQMGFAEPDRFSVSNPSYIGADGAFSYQYKKPYESGYIYQDETGVETNITAWCK